MSSPTDRHYSDSHEWFLLNGDTVTIGITRHAADALTDITYVEMQPAGTPITAGESIGEVESVKTTAEVVCVLAGTIKEVNDALTSDPAILNSDPYDAGWLLKLSVEDASGLDALMDGATYDQRHGC